MRAREGLASLLWTMGRRDEAIGHLQEMLRLNPNDNQGVRYTLSSWLPSEGRDDDLARLLDEYGEEGSATWAYHKALLAFRRGGDTPEARALLRAAKTSNRHVPAYLLDRKPLPMEQPDSYSRGSEKEAILYAGGALSGWKETPGATAWLKQSEPATKAKAKARKAAGPKTEGPLPIVKKRLEKLPQEFDVWEADVRQVGPRVKAEGELVQPWVVLVVSASNDLVLGQAMLAEPPPEDLLWDVLAGAMRKPAAGEPHRPTELRVRADARWDALAAHLDEVGVQLVPAEELEIDFLYKDLAEFLARDEPPGLLDLPGIEAGPLAGFYQAAAEFYRQAPWRKLGYEAAIQVACDRFESGPWFAVVMGQSGITFGVALYDDLNLLKKLWAGTMSDETRARATVALSMTFGDEEELTNADLDAIERYDFEVAGPTAYPSIFRKERGMTVRPPLAWELELMEGVLRALPRFVKEHREDDLAEQTLSVPTASGDLTLTLSWTED
jgi:tetratricopeptide (TPR) repeat protein